MPITGIQFHRVSSSHNKYFIFVTTPTRLYQFIGQATTTDDKPSLQSIFYSYLTMPETGFQEIPSMLKYSKLQFFFDRDNTPKTFAWLTEPGIFYGQVSCLPKIYAVISVLDFPADIEILLLRLRITIPAVTMAQNSPNYIRSWTCAMVRMTSQCLKM